MIRAEIINGLNKAIPGIFVTEDYSWQRLTTLGVGTASPLVVEPGDDIELRGLVQWCQSHNVPWIVLGNGSNVVGADHEFAGIVIRLCRGSFVNISCGRTHLTVGAGVKLRSLIRFGAEHGWGGLSRLAGIPGTIGGALRMNAGAHGLCISEKVLELFGFDGEGNPWAASADSIGWQYRSTDIPADVIITGAILGLDRSDEETEDWLVNEEIARRRSTEPQGRNAGCVFRNPSPDTPAGKLIDFCGGKGISVGDAAVSYEHANYLINRGNATEADFVSLTAKVVKKVYDKTGIVLHPEVSFVDRSSMDSLEIKASPVNVAVLKGGKSTEREVSLESGAAVANALRNVGYNVTEIDIQELSVTEPLRQADVVFPVLHGGFGESGELQQLLEEANIEFVGCGSHACAAAMDKLISKRIMERAGLPTPPWAVVAHADAVLPAGMDYPVVAKAPSQGSTVGISIVHDASEWKPALLDCLKYDKEVLVEKYIKGREITVGIVDGEALTPVEIEYPGEMYDYDAKYTHAKGETYYHCPPAHVSEELQKKAQSMAVEFYKALGARDMIRIDFIVVEDGSMYILEGNTIPGFTASSLLPKGAKQAGMSFEMLCARLIKLALNRKAGR